MRRTLKPGERTYYGDSALFLGASSSMGPVDYSNGTTDGVQNNCDADDPYGTRTPVAAANWRKSSGGVGSSSSSLSPYGVPVSFSPSSSAPSSSSSRGLLPDSLPRDSVPSPYEPLPPSLSSEPTRVPQSGHCQVAAAPSAQNLQQKGSRSQSGEENAMAVKLQRIFDEVTEKVGVLKKLGMSHGTVAWSNVKKRASAAAAAAAAAAGSAGLRPSAQAAAQASRRPTSESSKMPIGGGDPYDVAAAKKRVAAVMSRGVVTLPPIPQMLSWVLLVLVCIQVASAVYRFGAGSLPAPRGMRASGHLFSEARARRHLTALLAMGPRPIGSSALHGAVEVATNAAFSIPTLDDDRALAKSIRDNVRAEPPLGVLGILPREQTTKGKVLEKQIFTPFDPILVKLDERAKLSEGLTWRAWDTITTLPYNVLNGRFSTFDIITDSLADIIRTRLLTSKTSLQDEATPIDVDMGRKESDMENEEEEEMEVGDKISPGGDDAGPPATSESSAGEYGLGSSAASEDSRDSDTDISKTQAVVD
ncbi:hypothetical protein CBR_g54170 [Chara braunii]|uniref:Uncharacterized protein n=1 Tax=Chara braunii TaxID=69332 RepID=A0A388K759_CHABU|nr:hypothetical protein CBR_g54170 [Chara braunii]|eukprot:GBG65878.1 hypothetical protein CBR_g54170 [Chara braunii]